MERMSKNMSLIKVEKYIYKYTDETTGEELYQFAYPRLYCKYKFNNKLRTKSGLTKDEVYKLKSDTEQDPEFKEWKINREPTRFLNTYGNKVFYNAKVLGGRYNAQDELVIKCQCTECDKVGEISYQSFKNRNKTKRLGRHERGCKYGIRPMTVKETAHANNNSTGIKNITYNNKSKLYVIKLSRALKTFVGYAKTLEEAQELKMFALDYYNETGEFPEMDTK